MVVTQYGVTHYIYNTIIPRRGTGGMALGGVALGRRGSGEAWLWGGVALGRVAP